MFFDFTKPAEQLLGDSIATNMMMMGYAYQKGLFPLSASDRSKQAIEVNGVSIKMNKEAFRLGRLAVADPHASPTCLKGTDEVVAPKTLDAMTLDEIIEHRAKHLTAYQNGRLAKRYRKLVGQVRDAAKQGGYDEALPRAVAINYAKLLRLQGRVRGRTALSPTALSSSSSATSSRATSSSTSIWHRRSSAIRRRRAGPPEEARLRPVDAEARSACSRSSNSCAARPLDIFGRNADRKLERDLIAGYEEGRLALLDRLGLLCRRSRSTPQWNCSRCPTITATAR